MLSLAHFKLLSLLKGNTTNSSRRPKTLQFNLRCVSVPVDARYDVTHKLTLGLVPFRNFCLRGMILQVQGVFQPAKLRDCASGLTIKGLGDGQRREGGGSESTASRIGWRCKLLSEEVVKLHSAHCLWASPRYLS